MLSFFVFFVTAVVAFIAVAFVISLPEPSRTLRALYRKVMCKAEVL